VRTRIALVAAIAVCIIFSAAVAGAVATTAKSPRATHARSRDKTATLSALSLGVRYSSTGSPQLTRVTEWGTAWRTLSAPAPAKPAPAPAPAVVTAAPPAPAPQPVVVTDAFDDATSTTTPDWACIRDHESGDNYADNTGNGYSGAYQFMPSTWDEAVSGAGYSQYANGEAYAAPPAVQNAAALWLYDRDGWAPWSTRYVCGL
jgi:Transglycosylase-like domain